MSNSSSSSLYRVGIIGCGGISRAHAGGYKSLPQVEIVAASDVKGEQLDKFSAEFGVKTLYSNYLEMLDKENLDIVSICTWPPLHSEMTIACAERQVKGVLCEKPMALNLDQADGMIEACDKSDTVLVVGHQRRFEAQYVKAKELIQKKAVGDVLRIHASCGGDLLTDGTHNIDLIRFYVNDSPVKWAFGGVDSSQNRSRYGHKVEDAAIGYIEFENGIRAFMEVGQVALPGYQRAYIEGSEGRIEINVPNQPQVRYKGKGDSDWQIPELKGENPFKLEIKAMIDCIENGGEHILSGRQAKKDLQVLMAIFESAKKQAIISGLR